MATKKQISVSLEELLEAGAHFGHQTRRWNPKMEDYIYGADNGVHVFDLIKTKEALENALEFISTSVKMGKVILLLGTKKQIREKLKEVALEAGVPYVDERWLGGTLSNFEQIRKSTKKLAELRENMESGFFAKYTKKERLLIDREITRLERFFGGIKNLEKAPDILFIVDTKKEAGAVREASRKGIPVIGLVDTNADPEVVDYPIPMNDDAARAVSYVLDLVGSAIKSGRLAK